MSVRPQSSVSSTSRASSRSWISCACSSSSPASCMSSESSERFTQPLVSPCATSASRRACTSGSMAIDRGMAGSPGRSTSVGARVSRARPGEVSLACRRPAAAPALEVVGDDVAGLERRDEPLDLVLHVGLHHALEVAHQRLGAAVELLVEALDDVLVEDTAPVPLAVGAAQRDLPLRLADLLPVHRVDELGVAGPAHVQVLGRLGGGGGGGGG